MGALVGMGVGIGLMLIWSALFVPRQPRRQPRSSGRAVHLLARAGLGQVSTSGFAILCLATGLVRGLVIQVVSATPPVALVFAAMGAWLPVAIVTGRECLDRLKVRLADPVGDRVVEGLRIAREVGGGEFGRLLRNLSGYLRDEARTRSELESRQAWTGNGIQHLSPSFAAHALGVTRRA